MQSSRSSVVRSGKVAGTCSHTLPMPGVHLPKANPAFPYDKGNHFCPLASPRGIFPPLFGAVHRTRQTATNECMFSRIPVLFGRGPQCFFALPQLPPFGSLQELHPPVALACLKVSPSASNRENSLMLNIPVRDSRCVMYILCIYCCSMCIPLNKYGLAYNYLYL